MATDPEKLLSLYFNGNISQDQAQELSEWIKCSDKNAERFVQVAVFHRSVHDLFTAQDVKERILRSGDLENASFSNDDSAYEMNFWDDFVKCEEYSPAVEIEHQEAGIPNEKAAVVSAAREHKTNRLILLYNKLVTVAAVLLVLFVVYANIFPPKFAVPVATVTDQLNVKWNSESQILDINDRVLTYQGPYKIDSGIIKLRYDDGVEAVIEGPAEFALEKKGLAINHGRLYSCVPERGRGFTVDTPNSRIIDLGTEFGVSVDDAMSSELHVIKGEVRLYAGLEDSDKVSRTVFQGCAVRFDAKSDKLENIAIENESFARKFNSVTGMIWRGQQYLDLADILAGGSGFGKVQKLIGIDPRSGKYTSKIKGGGRGSNSKYNSVPNSPFIDGVFVPYEKQQQTVITSTGLAFETPALEGLFTHEIAAFRGDIGKSHDTIPSMVMDGKLNLDSNIMLLHSNCGITFDLKAIRSEYPQFKFNSFKSAARMSESLRNLTSRKPFVDFFILVDGQLKLAYRDVSAQFDDIMIDLDLSPNDEFLTLIVTDCPSSSDTSGDNRCIDNDFFCLVDPGLSIVERSGSAQ